MKGGAHDTDRDHAGRGVYRPGKTKGRLEKYREGLEKLSRTNRMRKMKKQMNREKGGGSNAAVCRRDRREN